MKDLFNAKEGDYGKTGAAAPGKIAAFLSLLLGTVFAGFYGYLFVTTGEEPFGVQWLLIGVLTFYLASGALFRGLAPDSFEMLIKAFADWISKDN